MSSAVDAFLDDLTELSRKYRICIGGCGCCGSPYIYNLAEDELTGSYVDSNTSDMEWVVPGA